jgi:hypothetical protein
MGGNSAWLVKKAAAPALIPFRTKNFGQQRCPKFFQKTFVLLIVRQHSRRTINNKLFTQIGL